MIGEHSKLNKVLGEFRDYGFSLIKPDDLVLELYFKDKLIATLNQDKVTPEIVQTGCKNYLANIS